MLHHVAQADVVLHNVDQVLKETNVFNRHTKSPRRRGPFSALNEHNNIDTVSNKSGFQLNSFRQTCKTGAPVALTLPRSVPGNVLLILPAKETGSCIVKQCSFFQSKTTVLVTTHPLMTFFETSISVTTPRSKLKFNVCLHSCEKVREFQEAIYNL